MGALAILRDEGQVDFADNLKVQLSSRGNSAHDSSMQTIHAPKRRRPGRPLMYGEHTVPVRVPAKLADEVKPLVRKAKRRLPVSVVGKPIKALIGPQLRARLV